MQRFKENPSSFFLILSDVRMPEMDGVHLIMEILAIKPDTKIVMMTAFELDWHISSRACRQ